LLRRGVAGSHRVSHNDCPLAGSLAERLRGARNELVGIWLERIKARVTLEANHVFPSDELLDHVPLLIDSIATYLEDPAGEVSADSPLLEKAMELGELRHGQRFEVYEILKEYEILGGILFQYLTTVVDEIEQPCTRAELLACGHRLFRAIAIIQQVTTVRFMRLAQEEVTEREERLRGFNRALSHEVRNRLGSLGGAISMLGEDFVIADPEQLRHFHAMAMENVNGIERTTQNLIELSQVETEARQHRNVRLPECVSEATRQLRHFAQSRGVAIRSVDDLPAVEVPASAVELALINYLSNAIKYHDPAKQDRWVEVRAWIQPHPETGAQEVVIAVADNGIGVPAESRGQLFTRFFRAHAEGSEEVEGSGLGLSLVLETVRSVGGRVWAELEGGKETVFAMGLPARRQEDR
jgi:signal transduction histidine kinase